jgi:hypothetical protein
VDKEGGDANENMCLLLQILNQHITDLEWDKLAKMSREKFARVFGQLLCNCPNINKALINQDLWQSISILPRLDYEDLISVVANSWKNLKFLKLEGIHLVTRRDTSIVKLVCDELPLLRYFK